MTECRRIISPIFVLSLASDWFCKKAECVCHSGEMINGQEISFFLQSFFNTKNPQQDLKKTLFQQQESISTLCTPCSLELDVFLSFFLLFFCCVGFCLFCLLVDLAVFDVHFSKRGGRGQL